MKSGLEGSGLVCFHWFRLGKLAGCCEQGDEQRFNLPAVSHPGRNYLLHKYRLEDLRWTFVASKARETVSILGRTLLPGLSNVHADVTYANQRRSVYCRFRFADRMKWAEHVKRMAERRGACRVLVGKY